MLHCPRRSYSVRVPSPIAAFVASPPAHDLRRIGRRFDYPERLDSAAPSATPRRAVPPSADAYPLPLFLAQHCPAPFAPAPLRLHQRHRNAAVALLLAGSSSPEKSSATVHLRPIAPPRSPPSTPHGP